MDIEAVNFELQELAEVERQDLILLQYHDMVQEIMAGFYQAVVQHRACENWMDVGCEFDGIVDLEN